MKKTSSLVLALLALALACCALLLFGGVLVVAAQDQQPAPPAAQNQQPAPPAAQNQTPAKEMPPMPAAPSVGKAIVCIYRPGGALGSAAHDHLYVNGVYLGTLLNGEYAWTEVDPGTIIVTGAARMYYGPSVIMSTAAGVNQTRGQAERIRFDAEAGKIYYMKWSSGMFASDIKVKMMDPGQGAKEMHKLHPTKPSNTGEENPNSTQETSNPSTPPK
ncbi:MAG TPA: DUF2846 domain-containing protein [Methylomirabilota bacterium]|jgi:hypothetical protein|nr:DUF2846 domain-containing protein [Methylomirabilota bacterium]